MGRGAGEAERERERISLDVCFRSRQSLRFVREPCAWLEEMRSLALTCRVGYGSFFGSGKPFSALESLWNGSIAREREKESFDKERTFYNLLVLEGTFCVPFFGLGPSQTW